MNKYVLAIVKSWYGEKRTFWQFLLAPLSWLYWIVSSIRKFFYRIGVYQTYHFKVPVIVIGNISVGGTGKTPVVIKLYEMAKAQGFNPGIVSRGFGGGYKDLAWVKQDSLPSFVGDEPALIVQKTNAPMVVAKKRIDAVKALIKEGCDLIVSDDGLQHYALARDFEVILIDGQRFFGNGILLPAGPLREPVKRIKQSDLVLINSGRADYGASFSIKATCFRAVNDGSKTLDLTAFSGQQVHAVAGLANPDRFFQSLENLGLKLIKHVLPDHHQYSQADIAYGDLPVIMTGKDAVKCHQFAGDNCWYLDIDVELEKSAEEKIVSKLISWRS